MPSPSHSSLPGICSFPLPYHTQAPIQLLIHGVHYIYFGNSSVCRPPLSYSVQKSKMPCFLFVCFLTQQFSMPFLFLPCAISQKLSLRRKLWCGRFHLISFRDQKSELRVVRCLKSFFFYIFFWFSNCLFWQHNSGLFLMRSRRCLPVFGAISRKDHLRTSTYIITSQNMSLHGCF